MTKPIKVQRETLDVLSNACALAYLAYPDEANEWSRLVDVFNSSYDEEVPAGKPYSITLSPVSISKVLIALHGLEAYYYSLSTKHSLIGTKEKLRATREATLNFQEAIRA